MLHLTKKILYSYSDWKKSGQNLKSNFILNIANVNENRKLSSQKNNQSNNIRQ